MLLTFKLDNFPFILTIVFPLDMYVTLILGVLGLWLLWTGFHLVCQMVRARAIGLPWTVFPFTEMNTFFMTLCSFDWVLHIINHWLPVWLADLINDNVMTHHFSVRDRRTKQLGTMYIIATPENVRCHVADAAVVNQICSSRHQFPKPLDHYGSMTLYGPNVVASEGKEWTRHRRHTVSALSEKNNALVWQETVLQTTQMLQYWSEQYTTDSAGRIQLSPKDDVLKLTLNVLCSAGFGVQLPFKPSPDAATNTTVATMFRDARKPPPGFKFTLRAVMEYMTGHWNSIFIANAMLPKSIPRAFFPCYRDDFAAYDDLGQYLRAMIAQVESDGVDHGRPYHNVLQGLVRARHLLGRSEDAQTSSLSDIEVLGNAHVFMLAHESTGATIRFALVLMAMHQDIQEWMYQSICDVVREYPTDPQNWDYAVIYTKLVGPLCVMLETMRLYPPAPVIIKTTGQSSADVTYQERTILLPPNSNVSMNITSLHYSPEYWGDDATVYDPSRWDKRNVDSFLARNDDQPGLAAAGLEYPTIHKPVRGAYIPFSDGIRSCLGKKFAQVEFVTLFAVVFSRYRVDIAVAAGQKRSECVARAVKALDESVCFALSLDMIDDVPLSFHPR
ncbi:hypothetical protein N7522_004321 [Penicillium canescens]|uniref:Cytochrome P450 n=1 Tax=Penicillium canescens TaxID=5083 RepID=A0AAD6I1K0_PENCN|nr:uncharacterized protein N7446_004214 [Penicillium canescens]KAJ6009305.1 hypothetical protein N7522_004321 [Penicillium canescens]KAJ6027185.1 hypothetical protein N7460_012002 [Penicillium canescens]KAJ6040467.1 hypothetical protein N7444_009372 [Penicillium canescens]KAJ6067177.1 hypothetical protein N7446_004214 [Penicillium canescens]